MLHVLSVFQFEKFHTLLSLGVLYFLNYAMLTSSSSI